MYYFFLKFEPIQFGLFYSKEMKEYLKENAYQYDCLFFMHKIKSILPKNFSGKTTGEVGDLYSENYLQTFNHLNVLNPLKYIYLISILVNKIENKIFFYI